MNRTPLVVALALLVLGVAGVAHAVAGPTTDSHSHHVTPGAHGHVQEGVGAKATSDGRATDAAGGAPPRDQLVSPEPQASELWPYTSRTRSTTGRTLAINVVVTGDPTAVRRALTNRSEATWTDVDRDGDVDVHESTVPWRHARGAARYSYVVPPNASGQWVESTYQLGTGTYLGKRVHVRAYPAPTGNWTALQAHSEYWDWFRLRHTVTGVPPAAAFVGDDLRNEPYVANVTRQHHGKPGGGSDGHFVVVEFTTLALLAGSVVGHTDVDPPDVLVPAAVVGVVLGVRLLGLGAETLLPAVSPKVFAAALYPVLVAGPPVAVAKLARRRPAGRTGVVAAGALVVALALDATLVGVVDPPPKLVAHRLGLAAVFGALAGAIASDRRRATVVGVLAWLLALGAPLFGVL